MDKITEILHAKQRIHNNLVKSMGHGEKVPEISEEVLNKAQQQGLILGTFNEEQLNQYQLDFNKAMDEQNLTKEQRVQAIEKAKKDLSKLVKVTKMTKDGKKTTVYVKPGDMKTEKKKKKQETEENPFARKTTNTVKRSIDDAFYKMTPKSIQRANQAYKELEKRGEAKEFEELVANATWDNPTVETKELANVYKDVWAQITGEKEFTPVNTFITKRTDEAEDAIEAAFERMSPQNIKRAKLAYEAMKIRGQADEIEQWIAESTWASENVEDFEEDEIAEMKEVWKQISGKAPKEKTEEKNPFSEQPSGKAESAIEAAFERMSPENIKQAKLAYEALEKRGEAKAFEKEIAESTWDSDFVDEEEAAEMKEVWKKITGK